MNNRNLTAVFLGMATLALLIGVVTMSSPLSDNNSKNNTLQPQQINQMLPQNNSPLDDASTQSPQIDTSNMTNKINSMDSNVDKNIKSAVPDNSAKISLPNMNQ